MDGTEDVAVSRPGFPPQTADRYSGVKLAELVAAFSLAMDLGMGQPMEHVLRAWLIATRLGDHLGVEPGERGALYYTTTLAWVGCVADTPEVAAVFGDDIAFRRDYYQVDLAGLPMLGFVLRRVGANSPALHRLRVTANLVVTGGKSVERGLLSHCLTTARMAERLGLDDRVCRPLQQVFTRWDGKGVPGDVGGEEIAFPMRLFHLADTVEVHHQNGGVDAAVDVAQARRGTPSAPWPATSSASRRTSPTGGPSSTSNPHCKHASPRASSTAPSRRSPTSPISGRRREPVTPAAWPSSPSGPHATTGCLTGT
jgi:hypothetical protein